MSTLRMNPVDPFDLWSDQKFIKSKYEQNSISKVKKQEKEVCLFDNGSKLQVVKCQLCSSNIFPYCPNPNEIIWMCENEDCIYPFGDAPHHVDEVCLFKPQNSSCSLSKQAQLIQEGKLGSNSGKSKDTKVEVQTELCESMRKVKSLLTNYQQNCGPDCSCNSENYQECLDNVNHPDHFRLMPERKLGDHQEFSFSIESDTMFKVEKNLDSENGQISNFSNFDEKSSNLDDVEMEDEEQSFTMSQVNTKPTKSKVDKPCECVERFITSRTAHYFYE